MKSTGFQVKSAGFHVKSRDLLQGIVTLCFLCVLTDVTITLVYIVLRYILCLMWRVWHSIPFNILKLVDRTDLKKGLVDLSSFGIWQINIK